METFLTLLVACMARPGGFDYFNISMFIDRKKRHPMKEMNNHNTY